jgi:hypothetical protein
MKATFRVLAVLAVMVGAASLASANSFTFTILATDTFGTPSNPTTPTGVTTPTIYSLATLGTDLGLSMSVGSTISFTAVGEVCSNPAVQNCNSSSSTNEVPVSSIVSHPPIEGFFVGSSSLPSGASVTNLSPTGLDLWTANVVGMFDITAGGTGNIIIPTGATGIEFAYVDSYYADNSDFSHTLGVQANASASGVPEPATYGMMIAGLGALVAFKRLRRS